jgi:hypothetical protein
MVVVGAGRVRRSRQGSPSASCLGQLPPLGLGGSAVVMAAGSVVRRACLGGLIHEYVQVASGDRRTGTHKFPARIPEAARSARRCGQPGRSAQDGHQRPTGAASGSALRTTEVPQHLAQRPAATAARCRGHCRSHPARTADCRQCPPRPPPDGSVCQVGRTLRQPEGGHFRAMSCTGYLRRQQPEILVRFFDHPRTRHCLPK